MGSVPRSLRALRVGILALLLPLSACQANNPILTPQTGEVIQAGTTYNITWTPNTGDEIGIELWNGISLADTLSSDCFEDEDSEFCTQVVSSMNNSGFYLWAVPADAPQSETYWLDIYVPNPGFDGPFFYLTGNFTIERSPKGASPTSASSVQSLQTGTSSGNATGATTSSSRSFPAATVGGVVGAVLGIALLASVATVYIIYRRRRGPKEHQRKSIQLNSLPSGRTAEHSDVEDPFDEKNEIEDEATFGGNSKSNGIRYLEDDEQDLSLPSARLNPL